MANGFQPDVTPPGSAPLPLGSPLQPPIRSPSAPVRPKAPVRGPRTRAPLSPKQSRLVQARRRTGRS